MNDRYLYRAKRTDNGEWAEGFLVKGKWYLNGREICAILPMDLCIYPHCEISEWIEIEQSTICQCTGIKDKNGNLIFEHDILNLSMSGKVEVEFNDGVWGSDFGDGCILPMRNSLFGEGGVVIGNIFDNQELLEVE